MPYASAEARRACKKRWYANNKEKVSKQYKGWLDRNPDYQKKYQVKRREEYKAQGIRSFLKLGLRISEANELVIKKAQGCVLCGSSGPLHLDHIQPKSRGGTNAYGNLQWLCATCNQAKGALTPEEFIAHIRKILARFQ